METSNDAQQEIQHLVQLVNKSYVVFLEDERLKDTHLTRMAYFSAVRKMYVDHPPTESKEVQKAMIFRLEGWMAQTNDAMLDSMPPVPESLRLHVAHKR